MSIAPIETFADCLQRVEQAVHSGTDINAVEQVLKGFSDLLTNLPSSLSSQYYESLRILGFKLWHIAHDAKKKESIGSIGVCKIKQIAANCLSSTLVHGDDKVSHEELLNIARAFLSTAESWKKEDNHRQADGQYTVTITTLDHLLERRVPTVVKDVNSLLIKALSGKCLVSTNLEDEATAWKCIVRLQELRAGCGIDDDSAKDVLMSAYRWAKIKYQTQKHDQVPQWIQVCIEVNLARGVNVDKRGQSSYYGMLADVYLNSNHKEEAKKCIDLAAAECYNANVECLRIKYLLMNENYSAACDTLIKLVQDTSSSVSIGLAGTQLVAVHHNNELCTTTANNSFADLLRRVKKMATDSVYPSEYATIRVEWLTLVLKPAVFTKQAQLSQRLVDSIIAEHSSGASKLNNNYVMRVANLLFEVGQNSFSDKKYDSAVDWYTKAYKILPQEDKENQAKCMRMVALSRMSLGHLDEAMIAAKGAYDADPNDAGTKYLIARINVARGVEPDLTALVKDADYIQALIHTAPKDSPVIPSCLRVLVDVPELSRSSRLDSILTLLKAKDVKKASLAEVRDTVFLISKGVDILEHSMDTDDDVARSCEGLARFTWNFALELTTKITRSPDELAATADVFSYCHKYCSKLSDSDQWLVISCSSQLTALVMKLSSVSAAPSPDPSVIASLGKALDELRSNLKTLPTISDPSFKNISASIPESLAAATLHWRLLDKQTEISKIVADVSDICSSPHVWLSCAAVACTTRPDVTMACLERYLEVARKNILGSSPSDNNMYMSAVRDYAVAARELITFTGKVKDINDAYPVYSNMLSTLQADTNLCSVSGIDSPYPQIELEWLLATAWNNGMNSVTRNPAFTEKWCAMALEYAPFVMGSQVDKLRSQYTRILANK